MSDCEYPENAKSTAYQKGCRCSRCQTHASEAYQQARSTPIKSLRRRASVHRSQGGTATTEEYVEAVLLTTCCEACGDFLADYKDRCVDHDHQTGKLRGILCQVCNKSEGLLKTLDRAQGLADYMRNNNNG